MNSLNKITPSIEEVRHLLWRKNVWKKMKMNEKKWRKYVTVYQYTMYILRVYHIHLWPCSEN